MVVQPILDPTTEGSMATTSHEGLEPLPWARPRWKRFAPIAVGIAAAALVAGFATMRRPDVTPSAQAPASDESTPSATEPAPSPAPGAATAEAALRNDAPIAADTASAATASSPTIASAPLPAAVTKAAATAARGAAPAKAAAADSSAEPAAEEAAPEPAAAPTPTRSLFEAMEFDRSKASEALTVASAETASCKSDGEGGQATVRVTFASSGRVTQVAVGGPFSGTPTGACIAAPFSRASVPPFAGSPVTVSKSVTVH
jgi:hypothetical protein